MANKLKTIIVIFRKSKLIHLAASKAKNKQLTAHMALNSCSIAVRFIWGMGPDPDFRIYLHLHVYINSWYSMCALQGAEHLHWVIVCLLKEMPDDLFITPTSACYQLPLNQPALSFLLCVRRTWTLRNTALDWRLFLSLTEYHTSLCALTIVVAREKYVFMCCISLGTKMWFELFIHTTFFVTRINNSFNWAFWL